MEGIVAGLEEEEDSVVAVVVDLELSSHCHLAGLLLVSTLSRVLQV